MSDSVPAIGRCLEDFESGVAIRDWIRRTVTSSDNT